MSQIDRGSYRKKESLSNAFWHSCLGRTITYVSIIIVLVILAALSRPSEQLMYEEMTDNIRECIKDNDSITVDWIDGVVNNVAYIFTEADTTVVADAMDTFYEYNTLEYNDHTFFATMRLYNNFNVQGTCCGIGVFGLVIPTLNYNDILLRLDPMRKDYGDQIIHATIIESEDPDLGENPDLGAFQYEGE